MYSRRPLRKTEHKRPTVRLGRGFVIFMMVLSQLTALPANAVQIQTRQGLQFKALAEDSEEGGVLRAGSIVDVPDEYRVLDKNGRVDGELTLNNWLRNAGQAGIEKPNRDGGVVVKTSEAIDFFYPVKILSAAPGSKIPSHAGKTYFLALRMLSENQYRQLVTRQDTSIRQAPTPTPTSQPPPTSGRVDKSLEAAGTCVDCAKQARSPSPEFARFTSELGAVLKQAQNRDRNNRRRTNEDFRKLSSEFRRTCGFGIETFIPIVQEKSRRAGVPADLMLSIMVQESSGRCFSRGHNANATMDKGLFGLNSATTRIRSCSADERGQIRSATHAGQLLYEPQCIENPIVNLDAALNVMRKKMDIISHDYSDREVRAQGFDEEKLQDSSGRYTRDAWRLAASAYNGGERWVMYAKSDLDTFNRRHGTNLDPYNWEDLRIFYLRRFLGSDREHDYLGRSISGRTSRALINLAYSENVVPRKRSGSGETLTIAELWNQSRRETQR